MPFLVLDRDCRPFTHPQTGRICQFATREEAEAFRKAHKGYRVIEVPSGPA